MARCGTEKGGKCVFYNIQICTKQTNKQKQVEKSCGFLYNTVRSSWTVSSYAFLNWELIKGQIPLTITQIFVNTSFFFIVCCAFVKQDSLHWKMLGSFTDTEIQIDLEDSQVFFASCTCCRFTYDWIKKKSSYSCTKSTNVSFLFPESVFFSVCTCAIWCELIHALFPQI